MSNPVKMLVQALTKRDRPMSRRMLLPLIVLIAGTLLLSAWTRAPGHRRWTWPPTDGRPYMEILAVTRDTDVTVEAHNFPSGTNLTATMGYMGTRGVHGIVVDTFTVDSDEPFMRTFTIPPELAGQYQIAIRLESDDAYPWFAFNWFYNNSTTQ